VLLILTGCLEVTQKAGVATMHVDQSGDLVMLSAMQHYYCRVVSHAAEYLPCLSVVSVPLGEPLAKGESEKPGIQINITLTPVSLFLLGRTPCNQKLTHRSLPCHSIGLKTNMRILKRPFNPLF
jgi:hypothetical protein